MAQVADHEWRKSSYSGSNGGQCVEVCFAPDRVLIRDSKYRRGAARDLAAEPMIQVPVEFWETFLAVVAGGDTTRSEIPCITRHLDSSVSLSAGGSVLNYSAAEWLAFSAGVRAGEFIA